MGGRGAGPQGGRCQQGALRVAGGARRRRHQGHVVVDGLPDPQPRPQRRRLAIVADGYQRRVASLQHARQGGQQRLGRRARRDVQRAQYGYAGSPA
ncbi:hypothetical protein MINTM007_45520 [Mycobacterium intracellulare]|nr:hypothetical protein MINTM007_45520 [Mycobacterium intracellulare]